MSVCAVMLVRDEADVIEATISHLAWHVDEILVEDHRSEDGTRELLAVLPVTLFRRDEAAYNQSERTTLLAMEALERGHEWVLPCDADEIWHAWHGDIPIRDWLAFQSRGPVIGADLVNHIPTGADNPQAPHPFSRMRWRERQFNSVKVCCRSAADLVINDGNHTANYSSVTAPPSMQFAVRHFTIRSEAQFLRKVRNMQDAYRAEGAGYDYGMTQYGTLSDEGLRAWYRDRVYVEQPVYHLHVEDPAPVKGRDRTASEAA